MFNLQAKVLANFRLYIVLFCSIFISNTNLLAKDHGELGENHDDTTVKFIKNTFKTNNIYDSHKIVIFLDRLKKEKLALERDLYET